MRLSPPLRTIRLTQPFGVNWTGIPGFYAKYGLKGHNGIDLSCAEGTPVYAVMDGTCYVEPETAMGKGYGNAVRQRSNSLEATYGHLEGFSVRSGAQVRAGELLGHSGNTGDSTGPHLHFGVRGIEFRDGAGPFALDADNGYAGCVDPLPMFGPDFLKSRAELNYGLTPRSAGVPSEIDFLPNRMWFWATQRRLMTAEEYGALRFGFWDLRTVLDPVRHEIWTKFTKPEAKLNGLI